MKKMVGLRANRGQITVFIILGLILLFAVGFVIYYTTQQVAYRDGQFIDREAQPVYDFVASCASTIAEEGIRLQGAQGGYLTIPRDIERTPSSYVPIDEQGLIKVPLWHYEDQSRIPSLDLMERDLNAYIQEFLPSCIDGFSAFAEQYPVIEHDTPRVTTTIGDAAVTIRIAYPVTIQHPDKQVDVREFVAQPRVDLKRAYELAVKVMETENRDAWFENLTVDLMTADPAIPFDGLEFDCSPKQWRLTDIKSEAQELMRVNLPAVRIENTEYAPFQESERDYANVRRFKLDDFFLGRFPASSPEDAYEHNRMLLDVGVPQSQLAAAFTYDPRWGLDLNGQPNRGGVLSSKLTKGASRYLSFLCTNFYHFTYDVIYPVMLTIRDPDAFLGKGFTFQAAFPVIIHDNEGARKSFGFREFRGFEQATGFCENRGDQVVEVRVSGLEPEIGVVELDGATVDYECVNNLCTLGQTLADSGFYRLVTTLPAGCSTPFIVAHKDGYLPVRKAVTSDIVEVTLPRLREMNVQIVKHPYDLNSKTFLPPQPLSPDNNVTVFLSLVNGSYDQFASFPGGNNTLDLIDGTATYSLNAVLTLFDDLVGGYQNDNLRITGRELAGTDTLALHVVEVVPVLQTQQYARDVSSYINTGDYRDVLRPDFT